MTDPNWWGISLTIALVIIWLVASRAYSRICREEESDFRRFILDIKAAERELAELKTILGKNQ